MHIRRATESDIPAIVEFNCLMAWETEAKRLDEETLRLGVSAVCADADHGFYAVAETDDRIVGCLMVTYEWSDWRNGCFWWIQSVFVDEAYRRRGVYRRMYEFIRGLAHESPRTVCGFRLYVERQNGIAQRTYADLGMSETQYRMYEAPAD